MSYIITTLTSVYFNMNCCNNCNSDQLIEGLVKNEELIFCIGSTNNKSLSPKPLALACEDCGHIHLNFSPDVLKIKFCKDIDSVN